MNIMQPKPNDVLTLSLIIKDFYTDKRGKAGLFIGGAHKGAQEFIANSLLEHGLINLDVLNKHRGVSKLRTTA